MVTPRCCDCGCDWPHPFLYDTLADCIAHVRGRCSVCSFFGRKQQRLPFAESA